MQKSILTFTLLFALAIGFAQQNNGFFNSQPDLLNWRVTNAGTINKIVNPTSPLFGDKIIFTVDGRKIKSNVKELGYWGCVFDGQIYRFYNGKIYHVLSWGEVMLYGRNVLVQRDQDMKVASLEYLMGNNEIAIESDKGSFISASVQNVKDLIQNNPDAVSLLPETTLINEEYHNKLLYAINEYNKSRQ